MRDFYERNPEYEERLMFLEEGGASFTYGDFEGFYEENAKMLRPGRLAFLFCENRIGAAAFYLTCLRRHVVPLLLERHLDASLRGNLIRTYDPGYLILPREMAGEFEGEETRPLEGGGETGYVVLERVMSAPIDLHPDLALLLTTSGSTGSPKLVRQSRKNIQSNAESIVSYLEISDSERPITSLPMQYTFGLSIINSHVLAGAAVLLTRRSLFEREFWDFFKNAGATSISGVPYTYEMLKRLRFLEMDLPSLRTMTQAGGKLAPALHREFAEFAKRTGRKFVVMYGQTEATARMGYLPADRALEKCGSMGIAIPGGTFRLMEDEKTEITEPGVVGELVYEGDNVTMGYAECRDDLKKGDERGGILFTGDMAKRDSDGFYYITGRKKRFLKMFGKRVNMDEIEQMFKAEYPGIGVACTGRDDQMRIFAAGKDEAFCEAAAQWISEKTGVHIHGIRVLPIDEIPKNESGKTLYKDLPKDGE